MELHYHFLIFPVDSVFFFNVLVFNVSFPKGNKHKKMKWEEGKSTGLLNLQVVTLGGGTASNNRGKMQGQWLTASLFATVWSEKSNYLSDHRAPKVKGQGPFCSP